MKKRAKKLPGSPGSPTSFFLIYNPNNPTATIANKDFFKNIVKFAKKYNILVCHDFAYSEMAFDGYKINNFLEVEGAKDVGIEFHFLSKTYNRTSGRIN